MRRLVFLPVCAGTANQLSRFFTVAQDGSGNFTTIQDAIFAVRDLSQQQVTIFIKKGVYR